MGKRLTAVAVTLARADRSLLEELLADAWSTRHRSACSTADRAVETHGRDHVRDRDADVVEH